MRQAFHVFFSFLKPPTNASWWLFIIHWIVAMGWEQHHLSLTLVPLPCFLTLSASEGQAHILSCFLKTFPLAVTHSLSCMHVVSPSTCVFSSTHRHVLASPVLHTQNTSTVHVVPCQLLPHLSDPHHDHISWKFLEKLSTHKCCLHFSHYLHSLTQYHLPGDLDIPSSGQGYQWFPGWLIQKTLSVFAALKPSASRDRDVFLLLLWHPALLTAAYAIHLVVLPPHWPHSFCSPGSGPSSTWHLNVAIPQGFISAVFFLYTYSPAALQVIWL